jgi:LysM repeat protein
MRTFRPLEDTMTTIATPASSSATIPSAKTRLRLTARGRRVLTGAAALPIVVAVAVAALGGGAALATGESGAPAGSFAEVTVMAGDSLWTIAQDVAPTSDPRDVIAAIRRLNALDSATVSAGQRLAIPAEYAPAS